MPHRPGFSPSYFSDPPPQLHLGVPFCPPVCVNFPKFPGHCSLFSALSILMWFQWCYIPFKIIKSSESVSPAQTNNTLFSFSCPRTCPSSLAQWLYHSQSRSNQGCGVIFNSFLCSAQSPTCTSSLTQDLFAPSLTQSLNLSPYHCSLGHFPCPNPNRPNSYLLSFQLPLSPFGGSFFQPCNHATSSLYDPRGTFLKTKEPSLSRP